MSNEIFQRVIRHQQWWWGHCNYYLPLMSFNCRTDLPCWQVCGRSLLPAGIHRTESDWSVVRWLLYCGTLLSGGHGIPRPLPHWHLPAQYWPVPADTLYWLCSGQILWHSGPSQLHRWDNKSISLLLIKGIFFSLYLHAVVEFILGINMYMYL